MKVAEALERIRRVGAVECDKNNLRLRFPKGEHVALQSAIDTLRSGKAEALALLQSDPPGVPWAEWKAAALNSLFQEQGVTGQPGRITAATIQHGERSR